MSSPDLRPLNVHNILAAGGLRFVVRGQAVRMLSDGISSLTPPGRLRARESGFHGEPCVCGRLRAHGGESAAP